MSARNYSLLAALIFAAIALLQLARALGLVHVAIMVEHTSVPVVASWIASGITVLLAVLGFLAAGR